MLLFDMHTHCFPDALAPKALPRLAEISACPYHGDGTYGDLILTYNVKLPAQLNDRQRQLLEEMRQAGN